MAKKANSQARANTIAQALIRNAGGVSKADLSFLQRYINSHADYAEWFRENFGTTNVTVSNGSVKNAKDAYNTYGFTPTPQRGKNGQDTASMIFRSGMRTNQTEPVADVDIQKVENRSAGRKEMYTATPKGGRTRTDAELQSIIKRGQQGATMSLEDQRIYDRWMTQQREQADAERKEKADAEIEKQKAKDRADKFQYLGMRDNGTLNDLQIESLMKRKEKADAAVDEDERKLAYAKALAAQQAEEKRQARNRELGLAEDSDISDEEYKRIVENRGYELPDDYVMNESERQGLIKGTKRTAYSAKDKREIDAIDAELNEKIRSGKYTQDEIDQIRRITENAKKQWYHKQVEDTPVEELTAQQAMANTTKLEDGTIIGLGKDGKLYKVWEPKQTESAEDKLEGERRKYLLAQLGIDRKAHQEAVSNAVTAADRAALGEFDAAASLQKARENWNYAYGDKIGNGPIEDATTARDGEWEDSPSTEIEEWVFGSDYDADVEHGYTGSYEDWLAEFGGGESSAGLGDPAATDGGPAVGGHMKGSYL